MLHNRNGNATTEHHQSLKFSSNSGKFGTKKSFKDHYYLYSIEYPEENLLATDAER
jgi:hypothetical protein